MLNTLFAIDKDNGLAALLSSIAVILALHLVVRVGKFLWDMKTEKDKLSESTVKTLVKSVEDNTKTVEQLGSEVRKVEAALADIPKMKLDLRRLYAALKIVAGDDWPAIRAEITQDLGEF